MREAVIVSTARTPIGKAFRGAFNDTEAPAMGGHVVRAAVERAGIEADRVEDVIMEPLRNRARRHTIWVACAAQWADARLDRGHDYGPPVLLRLDEHSHGSQSHYVQ